MLTERIPNLETSIPDRFIGHVSGSKNGPTIFFFGGVHGNEKAGVIALEKVFEQLGTMKKDLRGNVFGIRGNIPALLQDKRFLEDDLNRLWTKEEIANIQAKQETELGSEEKELLQIHRLISKLLKTQSPPFFFVDFHTTSSKTLPFITINDALINRNFAKLFPVPIVLGIEEFLEGPLLSYMNEKGYVSLGFESGQHIEASAIDNAIAFIWLTLANAGTFEENTVPFCKLYFEQLKIAAKDHNEFYEVKQRYALSDEDRFQMLPDFESFQHIKKRTVLGVRNEREIIAQKNTILFMPLYQKQGAEGFFLIRIIPKWALKLSLFLRRKNGDALLTLLPGIKWSDSKKESLTVNLKVARFYAKSLFHLLGFRSRKIDKTHLTIQNRERKARNEMYSQEPWF